MKVLVKISGEYFRSPEVISACIATVNQEVDPIFMCGGGNILRGKSAGNMNRVYADRAGMLSTVINAIKLKEIIENHGRSAEIFSSIRSDMVSEYNIPAILSSEKTVILAGGLGCGYMSTDTAAIVRALELGCECTIKVTEVGGVYDKDPKQFSDATIIHRMSYNDAMDKGAFDRSAVCIADENKMPFVIISMEHLSDYLKNAATEFSIIN